MVEKRIGLGPKKAVRAWMTGMFGVMVISVFAPLAAGGEGNGPPNVAVAGADLLLIRPLAAAGATLASGVFAVTLPLTYPMDRGERALQTLVESPWYFVGDRPLGVWKAAEPAAQAADRSMNARYSGILGRTHADSSPAQIR